MFTLKYEKTFDAAHRIPGHEGKCANAHGHTWLVKVKISVPCIPEGQDMIIDFGDLKKIIMRYDHTNLNSVILFPPTAENLAKMFGNIIEDKIAKNYPSHYIAVELFESSKASIVYEIDNLLQGR